jgi:hypothetical protein
MSARGGRWTLAEGGAEASLENTLWMRTQKHTHSHTKRPEATANYRAGRANCETIRCAKLRQWVCAGGKPTFEIDTMPASPP